MNESIPTTWDRDVDIVVVGYGAAGGVAAIEAHDSGAETLILEKMSFPGGLSIASAGGVRVTDDAAEAFAYLKATCGGRTPENILEVLAEGMALAPDYIRRLAAVNGASVRVTPALGNYPLPGFESLAYCEVNAVPELEGRESYHAMQPVKNGTRLFKLLEDNVEARGIPAAFNARAERLVTGSDGTVLGLVASIDGERRAIRARRGVILTCGGFEADREMQNQYFQATPILTGSFRGNTGDGIRMAQAVGADLWHMWHYHGPYGLKHPDPDYPFALYLKAIPMWTPGRPDFVSDLGVTNGGNDRASTKALAKMVWILVDQSGRRFMDEYPPYPGDTGVRPFDAFDPKTQSFPNNPAFMVFDEDGRNTYPLGRSVHNDPHARYDWSPDNSREIELGIFERADDLTALAEKMGVPAANLIETVERWNRAVETADDTDFGRQPDTMGAIRKPPFYFGRVHPVVINTQGGPRRDACQRVLNPFGEAIPRLYAAGELGSVFGHIYMGGGNLAECFVGGWTAARHAARLPSWCD
ncbi:FAD-dependent oxidoreductase [Ferruginivarius sediminum]|uniref:FAD-binding protein n=1 Tax=Ferruginivarius sediminum TaxID=2661937 RepID=A0A369TAL6_9PROT|nr:FAD-binding protein [Ferruginivarius sediminum]RDD62353.1 FAD-binding protein [Ferruginivarius sediminum]